MPRHRGHRPPARPCVDSSVPFRVRSPCLLDWSVSLPGGPGHVQPPERSRQNRAMASTTPAQQIAVVTGASSGIGAASARRLADEGYLVHCAARRTERIEALAREIGGVATACDVTDRDSVAALAERVGPVLHVLVNNAGGAFGADPV